jgi:Xaa-Pro aminopeptidase
VDGLRDQVGGVELMPIGRELYELRQVKTTDEIRLLEAASAVNALATAKARAAVVEGMTDFEVLAIAMGEMQRAGAEFLTHSVCVTRDSPQSVNWFARGRRLWAGDAFFFDVGCFGQGGYGSDICRTGFVGAPPASVRRRTALYSMPTRQGRPSRDPVCPRRVSTGPSTTRCGSTGCQAPRTRWVTAWGSACASCPSSTGPR